MNVFLLGTEKSYDTNKQVVEKGQVIQMNGFQDDRYAVFDIECVYSGLIYRLINLRTKKFGQTDLIRPLSQKFGIGYYFDEENPQFIDDFEITILKSEAEQIEKSEQEAERQQLERDEQLKVIGRQRLEQIVPEDAKAVIVAELRRNESDSMTDYFAYGVERKVILGFSTHTKDVFSEMRKFAVNFKETNYLSEKNADYEHREKYTGGNGYYIGESKYRGWIIKKETWHHSKDSIINAFALVAGEEANICVKVQADTRVSEISETVTGDFQIVDYSEKALAVFGDTKAIKDDLKALGGRFNPNLTFEGVKKAGWVFSKSKSLELNNLLTVK